MNLLEQLKAKAAADAAKKAALAAEKPATPAAEKPGILDWLKKPAAPTNKPVQVTPPAQDPEISAVEQPTAPAEPPASTPSLKMPVRRVLGGQAATATPAEPVITLPEAPAEQPKEVPALPTSGGLKLPAGLAAIKAKADARASGAGPSMGAITTASKAVFEHGAVISAEQILSELQAIDTEIVDEDDAKAVEARDRARAEVLSKGAKQLQHMFDVEMAGLTMAQASDPAIAEIARIVKLTFMRVQSAPAAWAFMSLTDKAQILRGQRAMAEKRLSATKSRKKGEAAEYANAVETMGAPVLSDEVNNLLADIGFDIGGL